MQNFSLSTLTKKHENLKFSIKTEINGLLSFFDDKMFRENKNGSCAIILVHGRIVPK